MFDMFDFLVNNGSRRGEDIRETLFNQKFDTLLKQLKAPGEFFFHELGLDELDAKILMTVSILPHGILGLCSDLNYHRTGQIEVFVNGMFALSPFLSTYLGGDPITTLAHEMIHAHQMVSGDLRTNVEEQMIYWKGKPTPEYMPMHLRDQSQSPWEKEASGGMYILAEAYRQSFR